MDERKLICLNDQGGGVMDVSDKAGTLRAQEHGHQPVMCYAIGVDLYNKSLTGNVSKTLNSAATDSDHVPVVCEKTNVLLAFGGTNTRATITDGSVASTILSRAGTGGGNEQMILAEDNKKDRKYMLRRLTPTECARLQGFPDWWTDGADGSDSAIYKMWGNGIALPCAADVIGRLAKELEKQP